MNASRCWQETFDVLVVGSGSAALSAALRASAGGLSCKILEKTALIGGTSAMSGAGTWIPANYRAAAAGLEDSVDEALTYLRAASPSGWQETEDDLWASFVRAAPRALAFIETATPLRFALTREPDTMPERAGGKLRGRMLSPKPLSKWIVGSFAGKIRPSTLPHLFTYQEVYEGDLYHRPVRATLRVIHRLIWRVLSRSRAQGSALVTGLLKGCLDNGCSISTNARVVELIKDNETGRIVGLVADMNGTRKHLRGNVGVVIASGGFEWNREMLNEHFPGKLDWLGSPRGNEGDGQRMVSNVGGALAHMDQANVYPAIPTRYEGKLHGLPMIFQAEKHAIVVNRSGKRFASEYDFNIGVAVDQRDRKAGQPEHLPAWVIADSRLLKDAPPLGWYSRNDPNWMVRASTLHELATKIGVPAEALAETVARFNGFCADGRDRDFHRGESAWEQFKAGGANSALGPIDRPPYLAAPFNRSILGTKGGARTNMAGQVVRADGGVIPGLYAAGLSMANPIGTLAVGPGTTIGPNLTWGFICGEALLSETVARREQLAVHA
ncbi:FAD-binding protein [Paraburkholderia aspalathi]|nr:FAD-binding protein [Paraburkholderia aspalathi]MBK3823721.1 FAD-binding protein [Paraburkholderia aspalathi]MBK3835570.1 FAD-binding protein [Paraburkholderia aspalathi]MBK3865320.1 FAD-binding protein [Paraburkholderia aspalathi]